ncbi:MAG: three-Cys-motif partner protein TcmP [Myxococcales bacterium]|nr:three-Cys-motif partner protein TcmP [Myxococcales bacterium]
MKKCEKRNGNCTAAVDPIDQLPVQCVGVWAKDKHHYLRNYLAATRNVRARFMPPKGTGGTALIDLFAGPGKARVREPVEFIDGSPLIATSIPHREHGFTDIILCDIDEENIAALQKRTEGDKRVTIIGGDCNQTIDKVVGKIPPNGFAVALIDPFGASNLKFETIRKLAAFPRMDLIIHFPLGSMKRNFLEHERFEGFLGLPRSRWGVDIVHGDDVRLLIPLFRRQLAMLGYPERGDVTYPSIKNMQQVVLYHLVFASKDSLGDKIWNSITAKLPSGQGRLF